MNNKGEVGVGLIVVVAVALIVGVILFQAIAQESGKSTNTVTLANLSIGTTPVNGTAIYFDDYRAWSSVIVFNETGDTTVAASKYTVTNNVINPTTGSLSVSLTPNAPVAELNTWTVDAVAQPVTYIADSGGRAVVNLILLLFAIALVAVALYPIYQGKLMEMFGK